jgi:hypothetical protein
MFKRFLFLNPLPMFLLFVLTFIAFTPVFCNAATEKEPLITVMNPAVREILAPRVDLPPRLTTLEGKTIYLVDMNYEGINGTPVMGEIQAWFTKNMPGVKTVLKIKKGNYIEDDPGLWKEIADNKAAGVIMGVAG